MESDDIREALNLRVDRTLKERGLDPRKVKIDELLPDYVLKRAEATDRFSVLDIARGRRMLVPECCCGMIRPNGTWMQMPDYHRGYDNPTNTLCPDCEEKTRAEYLRGSGRSPEKKAVTLDDIELLERRAL